MEPDELNQEQQEQNQEQQQTSVTNPPVDTSRETAEQQRQAAMQLIREANQARLDAERRAAEAEQRLQARHSTPEPVVDNPDEFISKPRTMITDIVRQQQQPIMDFINEQKRTQVIHTVKTRVINQLIVQYPQLAQYAAGFYDNVNEFIPAGRDVTDQDIMNGIQILIGRAAVQTMNNPAPVQNQQPPVNPYNNSTPPAPVQPPPNRVNSSPPPSAPKQPLRKLTDNERKLASLWGMTEEEYLKDTEGDDTFHPGRA